MAPVPLAPSNKVDCNCFSHIHPRVRFRGFCSTQRHNPYCFINMHKPRVRFQGFGVGVVVVVGGLVGVTCAAVGLVGGLGWGNMCTSGCWTHTYTHTHASRGDSSTPVEETLHLNPEHKP